MFASDVYGLIESCRYFFPVKSGSILSISNDYPIYCDEFELEIKRLNNEKNYLILKNELKTTNITTRDIDKGTYKHFLEKEIRETEDIVLRTILGYLHNSNVTVNCTGVIGTSNNEIFNSLNIILTHKQF